MPNMTLEEAFALARQRHGEGDIVQAEHLCRQILTIQPKNVDALHFLGAMIADSSRVDEGLALIRGAISITPTAGGYTNLGNALSRVGRYPQAAEAFRQATSLQPQNPVLFDKLGTVLQLDRQQEEAAKAYRRAMGIRIYFSPTAGQARDESGLAAANNLMVLLHYDPTNDAKAIYDEHTIWNRLYGTPLAPQKDDYPNDRNPDRRLKVGYVSTCLSNKPVGRFLSGLFANHDDDQFEVFCYSDGEKPDSRTHRLQADTDVWRETGHLNDEQLTETIRADGIDILIDLGMHTARNRMLVFARKPAPLQVTYLAYCSTTGLHTIDYRFSDPYFDPDNSQQPYYSERTVRLRSYWCYPPPIEAPDVVPPPAATDGSAGLTFGCLNEFDKINKQTLLMWRDVFRKMPSSRLILHAPEATDRQRVLNQLVGTDVPEERIQFVGVLSMHDYFKQYNQIDIALDPTPWCGGTTTCDALWMGVPVVSMTGRTAVSRGGLSILSQIGLSEFVARNPEQYVAIASSLASDPSRLATLRNTMRERMQASPLMDAPGFTRDFEDKLRKMWAVYCEK